MARGRAKPLKCNVPSQHGHTGCSPCQLIKDSKESTLATDELEGSVSGTDHEPQAVELHVDPPTLDVAPMIDQHTPQLVGMDEDNDMVFDGILDEDNSLSDTAGSSRSNVAFDIHHFFCHAPNKSHICKQCK